MPKKITADEDGNDLPALDPTSDVAKAIHLLEWARQRGFAIGPMLQIGDLVMQVRDVRLKVGDGQTPVETSIWKQHGYDGED